MRFSSTTNRRDLLLAGAGMLAGCASPPNDPPAGSAETDAQFRQLVERLGERPRRTRAFMLRRFDPSQLTPEGRILYEAVLPGAEADAALAARVWGANGLPYAVTHRYGAYRRAGELREDDEPRRIARAVHDDTNQLEGDARRGVIAPNFLLDAAIASVEASATRVVAAGEQQENVANALVRQLETLRALQQRAHSEPGVWRLPDGDTFYAQTLQFHFGARIDPQEAHERALTRARELQSEADVLLHGYGLTRGSVAERLRALAADPRHRIADEPAKEFALQRMQARLARTRTLIADAIEGAAEAPAEAHRLPAEQEAEGAAGYRRGVRYFVDLSGGRAAWTLGSVVHHELIPGHILQAPYEPLAGAPELQLRYAQGYGEGWATYAEQLADDLGAFADDPLDRLGYLQWMLFRMARVVADTGMHAMRWSRTHAMEQVRALQGESIAFVSIEDDIDRLAAQPGVHAAQGLMALHIAELRERTRRAAGNAFSLPRFHNAVLRYGPLSPPGLDQAAHAAFAV